MDEPLSNLDAKLRVSTRQQIKNLSHELQVTTIYVTHDQIEAMTLADRVVVMNAGVVQQVGTPTEIYDRPANTFVAGFIGNPAMNLLEGEMSGGTFTGENVSISGISTSAQGKVTLGFRPKMRPSTRRARPRPRSIRWSCWATPRSRRCGWAGPSPRSARPRTIGWRSASRSPYTSPPRPATSSTPARVSGWTDGAP